MKLILKVSQQVKIPDSVSNRLFFQIRDVVGNNDLWFNFLYVFME